MNRPNKVYVNSFADDQIYMNTVNGTFSQFTNRLQTPLLNVKGIQLLSANFVNPQLQLNDYSELCFFYYSSTTATPVNTDLHCVRLTPTWYVPAPGFTAYTPNQYFADGASLVAALNAAASTGGDSITYNPYWLANDITFTYNSATKRISFTGNTSGRNYVSVSGYNVDVKSAYISGTLTLQSTVGSGTGTKPMPYILGYSMNSSLGYGMVQGDVTGNYYRYTGAGTGKNWGTDSRQPFSTSVGYPQAAGIPVYADSPPILLGLQNVIVYCSVITGSGLDAYTKKNFLAAIPITVYPLNVNQYTLTSTKSPALSVNSEIYELQFDFRDDNGNPVWFYPNMSVSMELVVYY